MHGLLPAAPLMQSYGLEAELPAEMIIIITAITTALLEHSTLKLLPATWHIFFVSTE